MKLRRHYPNFMSGFKETEVVVNNYDELLNIPWISRFATHG